MPSSTKAKINLPMKKFILLKIINPFLAWSAKGVIAKNKPIIIGVTGSVGKSSTKEAIYYVLKNKFPVVRNKGNLNNETGLPLAIISNIDPKGSLIKWLRVFAQSLYLKMVRSKNYPKVLILEMAVDRPGDMQYLNQIAQSNIAVITSIGITHLLYFKNQKQILKEKLEITKPVKKNGLVILNYDDPSLRPLKKTLTKPALTYGFRKGADILATDLKIGYSPELGEGVSLAQGVSFRISYRTIFLPVKLNHIISKAQVYSALAAIAVGIHFGMNLVEITRALKQFRSLPGRMQLIRGKKSCIIIDDTYNAAPNSVKMALEVLALIKSRKKTIILGDMLELGHLEESSHREIARLIHPVSDKIILVGKRTIFTHKELKKLGFPKDKIFHFRLASDLSRKILDIITKGEVILIKGSQGMRMEKIVEALLPKKAKKSKLVRQDKYWKKKGVKEV